MSAVLALLLLSAPQDLSPREGSGWEGFAPGTTLKTRTTFRRGEGVPVTEITVTTLVRIEADALVLSEVKDDGLREPQRAERRVPRKGEAAPGEKAAADKPDTERVTACGRAFDCARRRTTFTGGEVKRVVTEWVAADPKVRVKRLEKHFDAKDEVVLTDSHRLVALDARRAVGGVSVPCTQYEVLQRLGAQEREGTAWVSRDVPGGTVHWEMKATEGGKLLMTFRVEVLEFAAK
jgi:hypothetical protein